MQPTAPKEIVQVMRDGKRYPSPVRALGSGSSVTRCVTANGGTVVDMSSMDRILSIEGDSVTVQPGVRLLDLAEKLRQKGLELIGGIDLADRSVGGAVCGSGLEATISGNVSQFAGHALKLKVISPEGKRFVVSDSTKNLLGMMRLSYGLLGIVYEVTLRVRPIRGFTTQTASLNFKDFAKLNNRMHAAPAGIKLCLMPFRDRIFMELRRPAKDGKTGSNYKWKLRDWAMYSALPTVAKSLVRAVPYRPLSYPLIDNISERTQRLVTSPKPSAGSNAIEQSGRVRALQHDRFHYCTWAFPADDMTNVVLAYKVFCKEHYGRTGFRCEMPTVCFRLRQDRSALLSPSFDGPVLTLSPLTTQSAGWEDFMFDFAEFAAEHAGIPLFNQTRNATFEQANRAYGKRLEMFAKMRSSIDPHDRLLNQFFATYLNGPASV
ncbi:MAG: FAD-binding protein [Gammaproteobacteria bacterium]|nr:FAD-binding protein [Gammaproteobacteria bacterium]